MVINTLLIFSLNSGDLFEVTDEEMQLANDIDSSIMYKCILFMIIGF